MPPDLTATEERVVVEIHAPPHNVTQVIGPDRTGVVEVHDSSTFIVVDEPGVQTLGVITAGPVGPTGPMGPQGPTGPFAPIFEQHFAAPSTIWLIVHNMGVYPVVTTVDLDNEEITGDVSTPDKNTVVVTFEVPIAGTARLKA